MSWTNKTDLEEELTAFVAAFQARHGARYAMDTETLVYLSAMLDGIAEEDRTITITRSDSRTTVRVRDEDGYGDEWTSGSVLGAFAQLVASVGPVSH